MYYKFRLLSVLIVLWVTDTAEIIETRPSETVAGQLEYYVHYANSKCTMLVTNSILASVAVC